MLRFALLLLVACSIAAQAEGKPSLRQTTTGTFVNYVTNADGTTSAVYTNGTDPTTGQQLYKYVNLSTGVTTYGTTPTPTSSTAPAPAPAVAPAPAPAVAPAPAPAVAPAPAPAVAPAPAPAVAPAPAPAVAPAPAPAVAPAPAPAPAPATQQFVTYVTNPDGTTSAVYYNGVNSAGQPVYQYTNLSTGVSTYSNTAPAVAPAPAPAVAPAPAPAVVPAPAPAPAVAPAPAPAVAPAPAPQLVSYVTNADGTTSAVYYTGTDASGRPVYKIVNMTTGAVTYSNTVPASAPAPAVAPAPYVAPAVAPAPYVAPAVAPAPYVAPAPCPGGTLVNNSDGTVSCVQQVGVASNGYPISKVTNLTTGVVSYVTQTGYNAYGQPVYQVTNQYGQVIGTNVVG